MESHRLIATSLVERFHAHRSGTHPRDSNTFGTSMANFHASSLYSTMNVHKPDEQDESNCRCTHESDVLAGQIIMNPSPTGYPEFLYRPQGTEQDMRLTRSSSMVSELAPLVLFHPRSRPPRRHPHH